MKQEVRHMGMQDGMSYLEGLNDQQREAVETLLGPVLIIAGAGTGKTRTLTARIAHLITLGLARPGQILAVAFTNKAANELRDRICDMTGVDRQALPWVGTFHSLSARILRREAERVGLKPNFTIYDDVDQVRILKKIIRESGADEKRWRARTLAGIINRWKDEGRLPDSLGRRDEREFGGRGVELYGKYQERLKVSNGADFGDLILHVVNILSTSDELLESYQDRFLYTLVDEYQDVNVAQYKWLRLLTQKRGNICCVGDDDQAIYSWRGAQPQIMLGFSGQFEDARIVRLEQNYRSTRHILGAAVGIIGENIQRHDKMLRCADGRDSVEAHPVEIVRYVDNLVEAEGVVSRIVDLVNVRCEYRLEDIAVSARTWSCLAEIEQAMVRRGIPYRVFGGPRFYERKEIRDALAYLKLCSNRYDDEAFERSVNTPTRGIGATTILKVRQAAIESGMSMFESAGNLTGSGMLSGRPAAGLRRFQENIKQWANAFDECAMLASREPSEAQAEPDGRSLGEVVRDLLEECGMLPYYRNLDTDDAEYRLDNLNMLTDFAGRHQSLPDFLEHAGLMSEVAETQDAADRDQVTIMTLHAAKGSEYPVMFLIAWEENILPWRRNDGDSNEGNLAAEYAAAIARLVVAMARQGYTPRPEMLRSTAKRLVSSGDAALRKVKPDALTLASMVASWPGKPGADELGEAVLLAKRILSSEELEEERRLAHVGVTRAKERCIISHVSTRMQYNQRVRSYPSRFLDEIPAEHVREEDVIFPLRQAARGGAGQGRHRNRGVKAPASRRSSVIEPRGEYKVGDRVNHRRYGDGTVHSVSARNLMVRFDDNESRMVMSDYLHPAKG